MNLFWKKLFRQLDSTEKFEQKLAQREKDAERYLKIETSDSLATYKKLFQVSDSEDFKNKRKYLKERRLRDTDEYKTHRKFLKLQNRSDLRLYFSTLESGELKEFLAFKKSPEYKLLDQKEALAASPELKKLKAFEKSKAYKNYLRFHNSHLIKEYKELKEEISSNKFQEQLDFWTNKNRWETTPEYQTEKNLEQLKLNSDISFFLRQTSEDITFYRNFKKVFQDDFNWKTLSDSTWEAGYKQLNDKLIGNYSLANEQQANNSGKNISTFNGCLKIKTERKDLLARAWDVKKGFVEKEFQYTSDLIHTNSGFRKKGGVFQAKIRTTGNINHCFCLGVDGKLPRLKIFHYNGKNLYQGILGQKGADEVCVRGLNPGDFHIYTMDWSGKEIVWYINNLVVFRTKKHIPQEAMFLAFSSFISQNQKAEEAFFEVEWVRVYEK